MHPKGGETDSSARKAAELSAIERRRRTALESGGDGYTAKRAEVIAAAVTVFREKGYQAATLNDIAAALNTDRASLYYYASGKEELLRAAIHDIVLANAEACRRIAALEAPAPQRAEAFIRRLISSFEEHYPHMYVFVSEDMSRVLHQESALADDLTRVSHEIERLFVGIVEDGIRAGEFRADMSPQLIANAMFGMVNWTHRWLKPGRKHTSQDVAETFSRLLFEGIRQT